MKTRKTARSARHPLLTAGSLLAAWLAPALAGAVALDQSEAPPAVTLFGYLHVVYVEGQPSYRIVAAKAQFPADQSQTNLTDLEVIQYENQKEVGWITAEEGIYYLKADPERGIAEKDVHLKGNVVFRRIDGFELRTSEADYHGETGQLLSEKRTTIRMPLENGQVFSGQGERFELVMDGGIDPQSRGSSKVYLFGTEENRSTAVMTPPKDTEPGAEQGELGQDMDLKAVNIEFEQENGDLARMVARGIVVMISQGTTLECGVLHYMPKRDKMVALGSDLALAHFTNQDTKASCMRLEILLSEEKYVMKGNVTIQRPGFDLTNVDDFVYEPKN